MQDEDWVLRIPLSKPANGYGNRSNFVSGFHFSRTLPTKKGNPLFNLPSAFVWISIIRHCLSDQRRCRLCRNMQKTKNLSIDGIESVRGLSITVSLEWIHKKYLNSFPTCRYAYARCFLCRKRATVETRCGHAKIGWRIFMRFFPLFGAVNLSYAMPMRHVRRTSCTEWNIPACSTPIWWQIGYVLAGRRKMLKKKSTAIKCWIGSSISTTSTVHNFPFYSLPQRHRRESARQPRSRVYFCSLFSSTLRLAGTMLLVQKWVAL